jgi:tRNA-Thr(GGU) m(6)t(6)A37 methyltransferase TsaA
MNKNPINPEKHQGFIIYHPIGYVVNKFQDPGDWKKSQDKSSRIVLDPSLSPGLQGFVPGQRMMVVFHCDRVQDYELLQHPRGEVEREKRGVFTLRSPRRPNSIGVTVVELVGIDENEITVRGLDALNGTPVLDLKPEFHGNSKSTV